MVHSQGKGRDESEQRGKLGYSNTAAVKLICSPDYKNGCKIHKKKKKSGLLGSMFTDRADI